MILHEKFIKTNKNLYQTLISKHNLTICKTIKALSEIPTSSGYHLLPFTCVPHVPPWIRDKLWALHIFNLQSRMPTEVTHFANSQRVFAQPT